MKKFIIATVVLGLAFAACAIAASKLDIEIDTDDGAAGEI